MSGYGTDTGALAWNGYRWELDDLAPRAKVCRLLERFPDLDGLPGARRLKHNRLRTVYYIPDAVATASEVGDEPVAWPSGSIVKVYRYRGWRERLRYRLLRSRSEQEWHALRRLRELGLAAPSPLAVGALERGGSSAGGGLVMGFLQGTRSLSEALRPAGSPARWGLFGELDLDAGGAVDGERRALLERVGRSVRRLHDAGAWHPDLHPGNLLVGPGPEDFWFIDLHSCRFLPRMPRVLRRRGVLDLVHALEGVVPLAGMLVLLEAYGVDALYSRSGGGGVAGVEARVRREILRRRRKRLASRARRCFISSSMFDERRWSAGRLWWRREYDVDELEVLWSESPPGRELKSGERTRVAAAACGGRPVCLKRRRCSWGEGLVALFESHRLRRAYAAGHALWVRGVPTPRVVALRERRVLGIVREAWLVTELVPEGVPLDRWLRERYGTGALAGGEARQRHELARAVGELARRVHAAGLFPHDLSPQNVVVEPDALVRGDAGRPGLWLVDLDHLYLWRALTRRGRRKNLAQLGNMPQGHVSTSDLVRGFLAYAAGMPTHELRSELRIVRERVLDAHLRRVLALERGNAERASVRPTRS